jgi:hypothetical protein
MDLSNLTDTEEANTSDTPTSKLPNDSSIKIDLLQPKQTPITLSNTLYTQQDDHRMWGTPSIIGRKSSKESHGPFLFEYLNGTVRYARVGEFVGGWIYLLSHETRFDKIKWH